MKIEVASRYKRALRFQNYPPQPVIDGVYICKLKKHLALEGYFMEYLRLTEGRIAGLPSPFEVRQISFAEAKPGRINAFHLHPKRVQDELWCVVRGDMLVWLVDVRKKSKTLGARCHYLLSEQDPLLLHIPSGVAHGYKAGAAGAILAYAMNSQFNIKDPNEGRLPWDHFGVHLWEEDRG